MAMQIVMVVWAINSGGVNYNCAGSKWMEWAIVTDELELQDKYGGRNIGSILKHPKSSIFSLLQ